MGFKDEIVFYKKETQDLYLNYGIYLHKAVGKYLETKKSTMSISTPEVIGKPFENTHQPTKTSKIHKKEIIQLIEESKKKKQYHQNNYVSISSLNTKEHKIKIEKFKQFTNKILSKPINGDLNDLDTVLHVLYNFYKLQGKGCIFTQYNTSEHSIFRGTINASETQNCVLVLDNLDDVISTTAQDECKLDDKEELLKSEILNISKDIKNNKKNTIIENLKIKLGVVHDIDPKYIVINDIYYGSAHIDYSIITTFSKKGKISDKLKNEFKSFKDLKLHPLFFEESFNINDFDIRGHTTFATSKSYDIGPSNNKQKYIQPNGWTRYGLKVLDGRYGLNNKWLHPFQDSGNWYRAYHGTSAALGKLILNGKDNNKKKAFFKTGPNQGCATHQAHCGGTVGKGVYCSPKPSVAESYSNKNYVTIQTTQGPKSYKFMFQVCVDPTKVRMSVSSKDIWVVPEGQTEDAMRPYGILIKQV